jgi:hypothetical protein
MRGWGLLEVSMTHLARFGLAGHAPSRRDHRLSPQQFHVDYHPVYSTTLYVLITVSSVPLSLLHLGLSTSRTKNAREGSTRSSQ